MVLYADTVFDAALGIVDNCNKAQVRAANEDILVDNITLDGSNFGSPEDNGGAGGGRKIECLVNDGDDMRAIAVDLAGTATKVVLLITDAITIVADLPSSIPLTTDDQINLSAFFVIFKDPT